MEKLAIISDIHGNLESFKAVLKDIKEKKIINEYLLSSYTMSEKNKLSVYITEFLDLMVYDNNRAYNMLDEITKKKYQNRVDFENNLLTINKAWTNGAFDTTKNKQSVRTMPLFDKTKQILLKYQNKKGRVFNLSVGEYQTIKDKIKKLIKIPNLKIKDMRSTFITRCKELNIPKHVIQSWVGHIIGSSVTDTVYTKHNADIDFNYINIINKSNFNTKLYSNSTHKKK